MKKINNKDIDEYNEYNKEIKKIMDDWDNYLEENVYTIKTKTLHSLAIIIGSIGALMFFYSSYQLIAVGLCVVSFLCHHVKETREAQSEGRQVGYEAARKKYTGFNPINPIVK